MQVQGMDQNSSTIDCEAIKIGPMPTIRTAFLVMELCQKLSRPSFKSYVNNISLCEACFEVEISMAENFLSFSSAPSLRL